MKNHNIGIVGATGAVGREVLRLLELRHFPVEELRLFASKRSEGQSLNFQERMLTVAQLKEHSFRGLDIVFFATDSHIAEKFVPLALKEGCTVIDKSSHFRMEANVPLIVPEINADILNAKTKLIASPNCSTTVAVMGLYPLHRLFGLKRFWVSTYQAVSGSGMKGEFELLHQVQDYVEGNDIHPHVYPHPILFNLIAQVDHFTPSGYTLEEEKMLNETKKIIGLPDLRASATCVRVPVLRSHSMAIHAEFEEPVDLDRARKALSQFPGLELIDDPEISEYPTPLNCTERFACAVGRLRIDSALDNGLAFWIAGDQVWKGAALNAIQIAEYLSDRGWLVEK